MKFILFFIALSTSVAVIAGDKDNWVNFVNELQRLKDQAGEEEVEIEGRNSLFKCDTSFAKSETEPTSAHAVRPGDIKFIGAVGDSLTAANGAKAKFLWDVLKEYRGVAWSMGGETDVTKHASLPNILKQFNPSLSGFSTGTGKHDHAVSALNAGIPGAKAIDMFDQAKRLVERFKNSNSLDSWKLVTFFIGGNDLCQACDNKIKHSADNFVQHIKNALDYMHQNLPKTIVNMVVSLDVTAILDLPGTTCRNMHQTLCDCALDPVYKPELDQLTSDYQVLTENLVNSGRYDTRDDFTVVLQPFMKKMTTPMTLSGKPDYSLFAPDCFHFSTKGHQAAGIELWNNMMSPVGQKDEFWVNYPRQSIKCPTVNSPFIYTSKNSKTTLREKLRQ